jgi:hypothetical protein
MSCARLCLQAWRFMRERKDKDTPNAFHVYESVSRSIEVSQSTEAAGGLARACLAGRQAGKACLLADNLAAAVRTCICH